MTHLLVTAAGWQAAGARVAAATVVETWGSSPRPRGSRLLLSSSGEIAGSVSGGCVEGAVLEKAERVLAGEPPSRLRFGVDDGTAWSVGLPCGGTIEVLIQALPPLREHPAWSRLLEAIEAGRPATLLTRLDAPEVGPLVRLEGFEIGDLGLTSASIPTDSGAPGSAGAEVLRIRDAAAEILVERFSPPLRLVVVGAVHLAEPLLRLARELGCRRILVDPRSALASPERFEAESILTEWPDRAIPPLELQPGEALVTLTHEPRFDLAALRAGLARPGIYLGALGSKRTHAKRVETLRAEGVGEEGIRRIHAPIGLNLGGRRPEEIALAILGEWIAFRYGPGGAPGDAG